MCIRDRFVLPDIISGRVSRGSPPLYKSVLNASCRSTTERIARAPSSFFLPSLKPTSSKRVPFYRFEKKNDEMNSASLLSFRAVTTSPPGLSRARRGGRVNTIVMAASSSSRDPIPAEQAVKMAEVNKVVKRKVRVR